MTELRLFEHNPAPHVYSDGFVETPDGFAIRYAAFRTVIAPVKGTVVLLQGRNETIEKYFETIGDLLRAGFDVATFDWRGQGGSTRFFAHTDAGYVESFEQYATDVETVFTKVVLPDCRPPYFMLAHSTGGLVALLVAPRMVNRIHRMVLLAPFAGLPVSESRQSAMRAATRAMCFLGLGDLRVSGRQSRQRSGKPFEVNNVLTSDARRYARNISLPIRFPEFKLGGPSAAWMTAVFDAIDQVNEPDHQARTTIPTLVFMAGEERVVSNEAIRQLVANLRSASLLTIDGARHEILQEADPFREQFFAAFETFVPGTGPEKTGRVSD